MNIKTYKTGRLWWKKTWWKVVSGDLTLMTTLNYYAALNYMIQNTTDSVEIRKARRKTIMDYC